MNVFGRLTAAVALRRVAASASTTTLARVLATTASSSQPLAFESNGTFQMRRHFSMPPLRMRDGTVIVEPEEKNEHTATIIVLHGLGASGEDMLPLVETIASALPYAKVIAPTAGDRAVTLNAGARMPAWYDLLGKPSRDEEPCEGIDDAAAALRRLIASELSLSTQPYGRRWCECTFCLVFFFVFFFE
jgi:poly(3-hydroxybutyrate) depolymerase